MKSNITSGLLINDISDHLPIFCVCSYSDINRIPDKKYRFIRKLTEGCIKSFNNDLSLVNWETVLNETDAAIAYTTLSTYSLDCMIRTVQLRKYVITNPFLRTNPGSPEVCEMLVKRKIICTNSFCRIEQKNLNVNIKVTKIN